MPRFSPQPQKGFTDYFPDVLRVHRYVEERLRRSAELFGYEEYDGPIMEPLEIYAAKSGEELVREQAYVVKDKGGRELALRPEMTPSLARMIAQVQKSATRPIRWYSVPTCFRYERPQRGRVREFGQANVDILGPDSSDAELEIFSLIRNFMESLGADGKLYRIRYSSRRYLDALLEHVLGVPADRTVEVRKMIDRRDKMEAAAFEKWVREIFPEGAIAERVLGLGPFAHPAAPPVADVPAAFRESAGYRELVEFTGKVEAVGLGGVAVFDPTIVRGLDYYTGLVYEVHDVGTENRRALFGGGRYDNLLELFSNEPMTGTGFGMGILTVKLFLETYGLLPAGVGKPDRAGALYVACASAGEREYAFEVASAVRRDGIACEVDLDFQKLGRQLGRADGKGYARVVILGEAEAKARTVMLKTLATGQQETVSLADLPAKLKDESRGL
ncbi:MAG: histidine--tRNA ligase [Deltaproteobacteria bacterium]|nr:histidine--tRNA ligase [Deltaproteobacteria bacterium]